MSMPSGISLFIMILFMIMPLVMMVNVAISEFKDNTNKISLDYYNFSFISYRLDFISNIWKKTKS